MSLPKTAAPSLQMGGRKQPELRVEPGPNIVERGARKLMLRGLVARITPKNLHEEQVWGRPVGREVW